MPIYFSCFITALLSVDSDRNNHTLPQSGRLLYCVLSRLYIAACRMIARDVQMLNVLLNTRSTDRSRSGGITSRSVPTNALVLTDRATSEWSANRKPSDRLLGWAVGLFDRNP